MKPNGYFPLNAPGSLSLFISVSLFLSSLTRHSRSLPPHLFRWFVFSLSQRCFFSPQCFFNLFTVHSPTSPLYNTTSLFITPPLCLLCPAFFITVLSLVRPMFLSTSLPSKLFPLCLVEVESDVGTPRRRPLSLCPCWSPEGNVTSPPLLTGVAGYRGNRTDLHYLPGSSPCCPPSTLTPFPLYPTTTFVWNWAQYVSPKCSKSQL